MTLIKQEKLIILFGYFIHLGIFVFLQNCLRVPRYPKISNFRYSVSEITKNAPVALPRTWIYISKIHIVDTFTQVIQSPFSNGDSPTSDAQSGETRFTYFPTSAVATDPSIITQQTESTLANATTAGGNQGPIS